VPETAIHKHCEALFQENEIGFARQRLVPTPAFDSVSTKNGVLLFNDLPRPSNQLIIYLAVS
jgi:hypothetical protein